MKKQAIQERVKKEKAAKKLEEGDGEGDEYKPSSSKKVEVKSEKPKRSSRRKKDKPNPDVKDEDGGKTAKLAGNKRKRVESKAEARTSVQDFMKDCEVDLDPETFLRKAEQMDENKDLLVHT